MAFIREWVDVLIKTAFVQELLENLNYVIKQKKNRRLAIMLILLFFYLAGIIAQFNNNRYEWRPGRELYLPSLNPFKGLVMLFTPFGKQAMTGFFCFLLIGFLLYHMQREERSHIIYDKKRNFYYSTKGTYGTAGWMPDKVMAKTFDLTPVENIASVREIIYGVKDGMLISRRPDSMLNGHVAVFGASGSMKSRTFARNKILSCVKKGESIIATDPKAELVSDTKQYLIDNGYNVEILNLVNSEQSNRFDALDGVINNPLMVSHVVDAIISNTGGPKGDHFFDAAEGNLLSALIFYLIEIQNAEYPTLGAAYRLILETRTLEELELKFNKAPNNSRCGMAYNLFRKASPNVQGNVIIGLGARLAVLQNDEIAELLSFPDMDFTQPGTEKCAYFLIVSDQDTTMRFISALFFSLLFSRLVHFADNKCKGKKLPVPVNLVLDEFSNIGFINAFHIKISTVRSRNINIAIIFQSIGQLQNRYPDNLWSEIIGNCDTQIFLGCTDPVTAELISERSGDVTIHVDTVMKQRNILSIFDMQPNYRQSEGAGRRKLLTPDEVIGMEQEEMLIILRGKKILEAEKFDYENDPESKMFCPEHIEGFDMDEQPEYEQPKQEKPKRSYREPAAPEQPQMQTPIILPSNYKAPQKRQQATYTDRKEDESVTELPTRLSSIHRQSGKTVDAAAGKEVRTNDTIRQPSKTNTNKTPRPIFK